MKICGLNIPHPEDRDDLIKILVNAGYKVSIERRVRTFGDNDETIVIVEENDNG